MLANLVASPASLGSIFHPADALVKTVTGAIASFTDQARSDIEQQLDLRLMRTVDTTVPGGRPFTENPSLRRLNLSLALATDVLLVVVVVVAALRSVVEHTAGAAHDLRDVLPKLLPAVVLTHLSLPLMQMVIDLDNALCSVAAQLGDTLHVDGLPWSPSLSPTNTEQISRVGDLFHGVFTLCVVVALLILVLAYILRHALLSVLVVAAPMAALCTVLPGTRGYARVWTRMFTVTVFMQAVQLLILRVATVVAVDAGAGLAQSFEALACLFLMLKVPGALNEAAHLETKAESVAKHVRHSVEKSVSHHVFHHGRTRRSAS